MRNLVYYNNITRLILEDMALSAYRKNINTFNKTGNLENKIYDSELKVIKQKFHSVESFIHEFNSLIKSTESNSIVKRYIGNVDNYITHDKKYKIVSLYNDIKDALAVALIVKSNRHKTAERTKKVRSQYVYENIDGIDIYIPFTYEANRFLAHSVLAKGAENVPTWCIAAEKEGASAWEQYGLNKTKYPSVFIFARPKNNKEGWDDQKYEVVFPYNTIKKVVNGGYATSITSSEWRHPQQNEGHTYWSYTNNFRKVFPEWSISDINSIISHLAIKYSKQYNEIISPIIRLMPSDKVTWSIPELTEILKQYNILLPIDFEFGVAPCTIKELFDYINAGGVITEYFLKKVLQSQAQYSSDRELKIFNGIMSILFPSEYRNAIEEIRDVNILSRITDIAPALAEEIFNAQPNNNYFKLDTWNDMLEANIIDVSKVSKFIYLIATGNNKNFLKNTTIIEFLSSLLTYSTYEKDTILAKTLNAGLINTIFNDIFINKNNVQKDIKDAFKKDNNSYLLVFSSLLKDSNGLGQRINNKLFSILDKNIDKINKETAEGIVDEYLSESEINLDKFKKLSDNIHMFIAKLLNLYWNSFSPRLINAIRRSPVLKNIINIDEEKHKAAKTEEYQRIIKLITAGEITNSQLVAYVSEKRHAKVIPQIISLLSQYSPLSPEYKINPADIFYYGVPNFNKENEVNYYNNVKPFVKQYFNELYQFLFYHSDFGDVYVRYIIMVLLNEMPNNNKFLTDMFRHYEHLSQDTKNVLNELKYVDKRLLNHFDNHDND